MKPVKQYNHNGKAGCVLQGRSRRTGTQISIYRNDQANMDEGAGPWSTVCEDHGTIIGHDTLTLARDFMTTPDDWCDRCQP